MPVSYTKTGGQGHVYQVPDYPETADGPKAFKDFADFLDLVLPPVGTIMPFVGNTAPTGWLLCQGQAVSSATYPRLATQCGTKFGTAPAGEFRLPDLRGRVIAGQDTSQTEFDAIGKAGGAKSVTLTVSNMPSHSHARGNLAISVANDHSHGVGTFAVSSGGAHGHVYNDFTHVTASNYDRNGGGTGATAQLTDQPRSTFSDGTHTHSLSGTSGNGGSHSHGITGSLDSTGGDSPVNTMNPYITMNHIIRAA